MNKRISQLMQCLFKTTKHKGHGNTVLGKKTGFYKCKFKYKGANNKIEVNNSIFYKCSFHFFGANNNVTIGSGCILKNVDFWIEGNCNNICIGNNCNFQGTAQLACLEGKSIIIGNNALISSDVYFRTGDSHGVFNLQNKRINYAKNIEIGNNVWICQKVTLLKGTIINSNCVVALGSIVTKQFEQTNCVIGGNPAKIIKSNINWDPKLHL